MVVAPASPSQHQRTVTDGIAMSYTGLFLPLGILSSFLAWHLALQKGRNERIWPAICFVFPAALIALLVIKPRRRAGDTQAFRERWASLTSYDPEIKAAIERLNALGPAAVEEFRLAYAAVQSREAVPAIVADLEARWAEGDRFDDTHALTLLHREGRLSDRKYAARTRRLKARRALRPWAGWRWQAPVILVLMWLSWPASPMRTGGFPTCDARAARELVQQAIEGADDSRQVARRLLALDGVRELSADVAKHDRTCSGNAVLNSGERQIVWRMYARGDNVIANVSGF